MKDQVTEGMAHLCVLYDWPYSQKCMECTHGCFVQGDNVEGSAYLCFEAERHNDGVTCPSFDEKEESEEESEE